MNPAYAHKVQQWGDVSEVDWLLVRNELANYLCEVIAHFNKQHAAKSIYGIVVELGQNWTLSVYLNTEEGLLEGPMRFRSNAVGYEKHTDAQILELLGRWYYQTWDFLSYECACPEEVCPNELHYELFERLFEQEVDSEDEEPESVSESFLRACAEATAVLEQSRELKELNKTSDFALRFYDGNSHEWETDDIMNAARQKVTGEAR